MNVNISIVFEAPCFDTTPYWPWPILDAKPFARIVIPETAEDALLGSFFASQVPACDPPDDRPWKHQLEDMIEDGFADSAGGISFAQDSLFIHPSCCCGLNGILEWDAFLKSGVKPWCGHDPSPWATLEGDEICVWSDGGLNDDRIEPCIRLSAQELATGLAVARKRLATFAPQCIAWLSNHDIPRADEIGNRLVCDFSALIDAG